MATFCDECYAKIAQSLYYQSLHYQWHKEQAAKEETLLRLIEQLAQNGKGTAEALQQLTGVVQ